MWRESVIQKSLHAPWTAAQPALPIRPDNWRTCRSPWTNPPSTYVVYQTCVHSTFGSWPGRILGRQTRKKHTCKRDEIKTINQSIEQANNEATKLNQANQPIDQRHRPFGCPTLFQGIKLLNKVRHLTAGIRDDQFPDDILQFLQSFLLIRSHHGQTVHDDDRFHASIFARLLFQNIR